VHIFDPSDFHAVVPKRGTVARSLRDLSADARADLDLAVTGTRTLSVSKLSVTFKRADGESVTFPVTDDGTISFPFSGDRDAGVPDCDGVSRSPGKHADRFWPFDEPRRADDGVFGGSRWSRDDWCE